MEAQGLALADMCDSIGKVIVVETADGTTRGLGFDEQLPEEPMPSTRTFSVQCHFDEGGPWAGPNSLISHLLEEIRDQRPDLIAKHALEMIYVMPRLRHTLSVKNPTLTDLAPAEERVRSYPIDRAFRILHGLIDLLDEWKEATTASCQWIIACDNYDDSGTMTRRFFVELMRRRGASMRVILLLGVKPGSGEDIYRLFNSAPGGVSLERRAPLTEQRKPLDPAAAEIAATALEEGIAQDRIELAAQLPRLIQLWKAAGRNEKVLNYRYIALDLHNTLGLYEDSLRYADGLLEMAHKYAPENERRRWAIAGKLLNIYVGLMDVPRAIECAEMVIRDFAQHDKSRLGVMLYTLAMVYARYQKPRNLAKGEEYLARGLAALEEARIDGAISEGEFHFQSVFNRNGLAMIRNFQKRYSEAIQICRDCVDHLNAHLSADKHLLHRSVLLYNLGQVYNAMGSHDEALEHYTTAIALDPNYSEYYNERGSVYLHCGRLLEAEADYLKAIELSPPYFEVLTNLGQCYRLMGKMNNAAKSYSRAIDIEPNQVLALLGRAKAYEELGRAENAICDYTAAIALDPALWEGFASRGVVRYAMGDLQLSLADVTRAIELNPDQGDLFENRAIVLADLGKYPEAEFDLKRAVELAHSIADKAALQAKLNAMIDLRASE